VTDQAAGGFVPTGHTYLLGELGCTLLMPTREYRRYVLGELGPQQVVPVAVGIDVAARPRVRAQAVRLDQRRELPAGGQA